MARKDKGNLAAKHPGEKSVPAEVAERIREKCSGGAMPCAVAFGVAEKAGITPAEMGRAIDLLGVPLNKCQLGLFGFLPVKKIVQKAESVPESLEAEIRASLAEGKLPCEASWKIAKKFRMAKIRVCAACEKLEIKISRCQLGAF